MVILLIWLIATAVTANLLLYVSPPDERRGHAAGIVAVAFVVWPVLLLAWVVFFTLSGLIALGDFVFLPKWKTARRGVWVMLFALAAALGYRHARQKMEAREPEPAPAASVEAPKPELSIDRIKGVDYAYMGAPALPVLGEWKTPVKHNPNRVFNIATAADILEDVVILPSAEFSFNKVVGPRTLGNGFVEAPGLFENEIRPTMGGGTCQVSSTLYAAALHAGMGILERRPHTRPSSYIEPGLDAVVSYPDECLKGSDPRICYDLRLKNPWEFPIVIHAQLSEVPDDKGVWTLTVQLKGEGPAPKGASTWVATGAPAWETKERRAPWRHDDSRKLKQRGAPGLNGFRRLSLTMPDGTVNETLVRSEYLPVPEVWEVGTEYGPRGP
jgi:hypothetical protein